eukprot:g735.t1
MGGGASSYRRVVPGHGKGRGGEEENDDGELESPTILRSKSYMKSRKALESSRRKMMGGEGGHMLQHSEKSSMFKPRKTVTTIGYPCFLMSVTRFLELYYYRAPNDNEDSRSNHDNDSSMHIRKSDVENTICSCSNRNRSENAGDNDQSISCSSDSNRCENAGENDHRRYPILDCHQVLLKRGDLVEWSEKLSGDTIIFVSHEWLGYTHPDPSGVQTHVLAELLSKLKDGKIDRVTMEGATRTMLKINRVTKAAEWKSIMKHAYIWIDFISMPQLQMEDHDDTNDEDDKENEQKDHRAHNHEHSDLLAEQQLAVASIAGYVELASFFLVLAPGCTHELKTLSLETITKKERRRRASSSSSSSSVPRHLISKRASLGHTRWCWGAPQQPKRQSDWREVTSEVRASTCYRTWRTRGWCLLELYAAMLSRKEKDLLIVRSSDCKPQWASPTVEACYAPSPGTADFSCCALDHDFGYGKVECDKCEVAQIMSDLLRSKVAYLFRHNELTRARYFYSLSHVWLRGLPKSHIRKMFDDENENPNPDERGEAGAHIHDTGTRNAALFRLKRRLKWGQEFAGTDRDVDAAAIDSGLTILKYAVMCNDLAAVKERLLEIREQSLVSSKKKRLARRLVEAPTRVNLSFLGFPVRSTNLHFAMVVGSPDVVRELLEAGADPEACTREGCVDPLMAGCAFANVANVRAWLEMFPNWDVNRTNSGGFTSALGMACMFGGSARGEVLTVVRMLLRYGADIRRANEQGFTPFMLVQMCKDADPQLVALLLRRLYVIRGTSAESMREPPFAVTPTTADNGARVPTETDKARQHNAAEDVNYTVRPGSIKWSVIYRACELLYRTGLVRTGIVRAFAMNSGSTALHWSARRGDAAMVRQLLCAGADVRSLNAIGKSARDFSKWKGPFPAVDSALEEFESVSPERRA